MPCKNFICVQQKHSHIIFASTVNLSYCDKMEVLSTVIILQQITFYSQILQLHIDCHISAHCNKICFYNSSFLHTQNLFIICNGSNIFMFLFFCIFNALVSNYVNTFPYRDLSLSYYTMVLRNL